MRTLCVVAAFALAGCVAQTPAPYRMEAKGCKSWDTEATCAQRLAREDAGNYADRYSQPKAPAFVSATLNHESAQDIWRRMYCLPGQDDRDCEANLNRRSGLDPRAPDDERYCRTQAQLAMAAADRGGAVYGGIMALAYGNQTYRVCKGYQ